MAVVQYESEIDRYVIVENPDFGFLGHRISAVGSMLNEVLSNGNRIVPGHIIRDSIDDRWFGDSYRLNGYL